MAWNWRGQRATGSKQQQQQQQQVEIESMAIPRQMGREYYVVYVASEHLHTHSLTHKHILLLLLLLRLPFAVYLLTLIFTQLCILVANGSLSAA